MDIKKYTAASKQRVQQNKPRGPAFPNIAQAQGQYSVGRDGDMTPEQLAEQQRNDSAGPPGLSDATVQGMRALHAAEEAKQASQGPEPVEEKGRTQEEENRKTGADAELLDMLRALQRDPINNDAEKEAVASRVTPIDISEGLLDGEYTQRTPVVPDKLIVTFRTFNVLEHQALRVRVIKAIMDTPELASLEGELMGLYQTVAGVKQINDQKFNAHIKTDRNNKLTFIDEIFEQKLTKFMSMPLPLIGVLGVHATWFDQRVRSIFITAEALKNG